MQALSLSTLYVQVEQNLIKRGFPFETVADTGAQVTVTGPSEMHELGLSESDLCKTAAQLSHVGNSRLSIIGSYPVTIQCNSRTSTTDMYFVKEVTHSLDACKQLKCVPEDLP